MRSTRGKTGTYSNLNWMRSSRAPSWTGTISCTIQTDDVTTLAEGLGEIVGRSLGQTMPKVVL